MTCKVVSLPGGVTGVVCSRGPDPTRGMERIGEEGEYEILENGRFFSLFRDGLVESRGRPIKFVSEEHARKYARRMSE